MAELNEQQKTSYALGRMVAAGLRNDGVEKVDAEFVGKAFADVFNDAPSLVDETELATTSIPGSSFCRSAANKAESPHCADEPVEKSP